MNRATRLLVGIVIALAFTQVLPADTYTITLDPAARSEPATGRVMLFFITQAGRRWSDVDPIEAPFFHAPQPIASIAVKDLKPGQSVTMDGAAPAFPGPLDGLAGQVRVQGILDADQTERSHEQGPGNVFSDVVTVELASDRNDVVSLNLTKRIEPPLRADHPNLKWVKFRSELLSNHYGRDVFHRAGVALPQGYNDPNHPRQQWPAIYVIPGYGGRDDEAEERMEMLAVPNVEGIAPIGVHIVLDPESPLGHHGFVDSPCNGPRETALVTEFIPYLESQFRLVPKPEARLITGHSSGGWSSLWLQLNHPEVWGGCWASSPDPVDFHFFQMTDLYAEPNIYTTSEGGDTPSFRRITGSDREMAVLMTVRQECGMEVAIDPDGRSGQQWDAWEAMFSPSEEAGPRAGLPKRLFDRQSGAIDKSVVEHWAKFDITRMVVEDWRRFGPVIVNSVRLACGEEDSFYLNGAVDQFGQVVHKHRINEEQAGVKGDGDGYVLMVPRADHGTIHGKIFQRWNNEMRAHLQGHALQDVP